MIVTALMAFHAHADPQRAGIHQLTLEVDGLERRYTVSLPELPKRGTVPVVLALHYAGHGVPHYATGFLEQLIQPALKPLDAIILAPDCPGSDWTDPVSEAVVLALLDHTLDTWKGDPERVMVTGYSMGGMGTWHLANAHPDRFFAAVPIAGHPGQSAATITVPVYAIHGAEDELISPNATAGAIVTLRGRDIPALWAPVDGLSHYQSQAYVPALAGALPWIEARMPTGDAPPTRPNR